MILNLGIAKKKCWNNPSAVDCCRHVQYILWIDELNALQTAVTLVVMTQTLSQETSCTSQANFSGWFIQRVLVQFAKLATRFPPWRQSQHSCDIYIYNYLMILNRDWYAWFLGGMVIDSTKCNTWNKMKQQHWLTSGRFLDTTLTQLSCQMRTPSIRDHDHLPTDGRSQQKHR